MGAKRIFAVFRKSYPFDAKLILYLFTIVPVRQEHAASATNGKAWLSSRGKPHALHSYQFCI